MKPILALIFLHPKALNLGLKSKKKSRSHFVLPPPLLDCHILFEWPVMNLQIHPQMNTINRVESTVRPLMTKMVRISIGLRERFTVKIGRMFGFAFIHRGQDIAQSDFLVLCFVLGATVYTTSADGLTFLTVLSCV